MEACCNLRHAKGKLKRARFVTLNAMKSLWLLPVLAAASTTLARAQTTQPLVIGEPVRHQMTPAKTARAAAGVDIAGLSDKAAIAKLKTALAPKLQAPIRLVIGDYQYTYNRQELGASVDYAAMLRLARKNGAAPLRLDVDQKRVVAALRVLDDQVKQDFENTALNVGGSAVRVRLALEGDVAGHAELLTVPFQSAPAVESPAQTQAQTKVGQGAYPYLLASFSTSYDAKLRGRTTNLKMAARNINGTIVAPGATFSTNRAIGPRNAADGWREAKMFVSGRIVSGTGSGICQAASTLYNAALLAEVPIVERHAHSMRVNYVPPSQDAALMWGSKDFKFRNTTGAPLRVETAVSGGKFHARLWSAQPKSGGDVKITSRVLSRSGGMKSEAYKIVGGKQIRLSRDYYAPHP